MRTSHPDPVWICQTHRVSPTCLPLSPPPSSPQGPVLLCLNPPPPHEPFQTSPRPPHHLHPRMLLSLCSSHIPYSLGPKVRGDPLGSLSCLQTQRTRHPPASRSFLSPEMSFIPAASFDIQGPPSRPPAPQPLRSQTPSPGPFPSPLLHGHHADCPASEVSKSTAPAGRAPAGFPTRSSPLSPLPLASHP